MNSEKLYEGIGNISDKWITLAAEPLPEKKKADRHLIAYELKKLLGVRYLWVFLVLLLFFNSAAAWMSAGKSRAAEEPAKLLTDFFALYEENPEEIEQYAEQMQAFGEKQHALQIEANRQGNPDFLPEIMPDSYSDIAGYSDRELFDRLYEAIEAAETYPENIGHVIRHARQNLEEFAAVGAAEDSFMYRYQERVIALYESVLETVHLPVTYVRGWDAYFSYEPVHVFCCILLLLFGSVLFAEEKQSGFLPILKSAKHGRGRTAAAKILTMLLLSACMTLLFTLSTFAVFGMRLGFSSPEVPLQAAEQFRYAPVNISIGDYFLIQTGIRMLTFAAFSMTVLLFSVLFDSYPLIYLAGLCFYGLQVLLYTMPYLNANNVFKNLNIAAAASGNHLFERYRAMNVFGEPVGFVPALTVIFPLCMLLCAGLAAGFYTAGVNGLRLGFLDTAVSALAIRAAEWKHGIRVRLAARKKRRIRSYSTSLVAAETFKILISSRFLVLLLALLACKVSYTIESNAPPLSYADAVYREYMTELEGEVTDEKLAFLAEEERRIEEILSKQADMQLAFLNDDISFDVYYAYLSDYRDAYDRRECFTLVKRQAEYLQQTEAETGMRGWFFYDTGWKKLFREEADLFLYLSILLLFTGLFAGEYRMKSSSGGFIQLLRSTKNGRHRTFRAKLIAAECIALLLALLTVGIDLTVIASGYDLPAFDAPLSSLQMFRSVTSSMTVGQYLILHLFLRIGAALLMALLIAALSELLANYLPVLGTAVIVTLLPALCAFFGLRGAEKINFLNFFAGTPLVLQSAESGLLGNSFLMLALWLAAASCAVGLLTLSAKKQFIR